MSIESMVICLHHSTAVGTDKMVLMGIANHDGDGGAWPSINTLARYANVEPRTVKRSLVKLGQLGEIIIYMNEGGTRSLPDYRRPNRYEITVRCPLNCDRTKNHRLVDNFSQKSIFNPVTPTSPGDAHVTPPGDAHVTPPGDAHVTLTVIKNHPFNPSLEVPKSPANQHRCRSCGKDLHKHNTGKFCNDCERLGRHQPMVSCTVCGAAKRRTHPRQDFFTCETHETKDALDAKESTP